MALSLSVQTRLAAWGMLAARLRRGVAGWRKYARAQRAVVDGWLEKLERQAACAQQNHIEEAKRVKSY
jgi:hypothetical protein